MKISQRHNQILTNMERVLLEGDVVDQMQRRTEHMVARSRLLLDAM
jgi:hypothetical protein